MAQIKFRPISYNESDKRAVQFSTAAGAAVQEGHFCYVANSNAHKMIATPITSAYTIAQLPAFPTTAGGPATMVTVGVAKGMYFPIFREDLDIESIGSTISAGDYCIAFNIRPGQEFEIHRTALGSTMTGLTGYTAVNQLVGLHANGKISPVASCSEKALIIGAVIGTFNSQWLRIRTI